jgi:large subunit ribosomal protein L13
MSTTMPKAADLGAKDFRAWYVLDAAGRPLGSVAAEAATLLRGKHKPIFAPHADVGDAVIILNAAQTVLTGRKLEQKIHYHHTGYIGHLKQEAYGKIMKTKPEKAVEWAVKGMLPGTTLGRKAFTRLHVYAGDTHPHQAQNPKIWTPNGQEDK